ncbi:MAG: TIGR01777 family oxidoreductase [Acidobacteriota bacterium]
MKIAITGATGLIGGPLGRSLIEDGHELVVLTRNSRKAEKSYPHSELISWDAIAEAPPARMLSGCQAFIHLAGENVAGGRWTKQRREAIRDSRVIGTRNLVDCIVRCRPLPKVLLSGSAIGFYGDRQDEELDESSAAGEGFFAQLGTRWEEEAQPAVEAGVRVAFLRSGIVLSTQGGALAKMLGPFRKGLGGRLGSGRQWMSWIHLEDEVQAIRMALENPEVAGPLNLTAPNPVTNKQFTRALAAALRRPAICPVPAFALKLLVGKEMAQQLLLQGQRVLPKKLEEYGFQFRFGQLEEALSNLLK